MQVVHYTAYYLANMLENTPQTINYNEREDNGQQKLRGGNTGKHSKNNRDRQLTDNISVWA